MNTIIKFITTLLLLALSSFLKANEGNTNLPGTSTRIIINQYIAALEKGDMIKANMILTADFEQVIISGHKSITLNKNELLNHLEMIKNLKTNCSSNYQIINENKHSTRAKIELKFNLFTRVDYITLKLQDDIWKINQVKTTYISIQ